MKREIIDKISSFLISCEIEKGVPATDKKIEHIENEIGFKLNEQYVDFVKVFGGTFAGISIYFIDNSPVLGNETIIQLTNWFRESMNNREFYNCLVFSDDGAGNPIFVNENGNVMIYYHDSGEIEKLYETFESMFELII